MEVGVSFLSGFRPTAKSRYNVDGNLVSRLLARQEVRYLLVGGWNAVFGPGCFLFFYWLLHTYVHYMLIYVATSILTIAVAYVFYKYFVFRTRGDMIRECLRFYGVYGIGVLFGLAALPFCVEVLHLSIWIAQLVIVAVTIICSFFGHKYFSFAKRGIQL